MAAHKWIWWGLALRVMDVATDWGLLLISLQSQAFEAACDSAGFDYVKLRTACCAFSIVGTLLAPLDIWGSFQRMVLNQPDISSWVVLTISILEDLPQLVINVVYLSVMNRYKQEMDKQFEVTGENETAVKPFDEISIISLLASAANICFNIHLMISTFAVRSYKKEMDLLKQENADLKASNSNETVFGSFVQA